MKGYSELKQHDITAISETTKKFFHFVMSFSENEKQKQPSVCGRQKIRYKK